jgi:hypothetical protein
VRRRRARTPTSAIVLPRGLESVLDDRVLGSDERESPVLSVALVVSATPRAAISTGVAWRDVFRPWTSRDGRVRVYGCAPGCLIVSLLVSVALTILLNLLIRAL